MSKQKTETCKRT
ncbi:hypothetical protein, partial [Plasmodium yoelii yoelii]